MLAGTAAWYWADRFRCPDDPVLAAMLGRENVAALIARGGNPATVVLQMVERFVPLHYIRLVVPPNEPLSSWLPPGRFALGPLAAAAVTTQLAWRGALLLAAIHALGFVFRQRGAALREPRLLVALALFGCTGVWSASQLNQPPYDAALMMPLLALAILLCLALPAPEHSRSRRAIPLLGGGLVPLALLSQAWVTASLLPAFLAATRHAGYVASQPYSVSLAGYPAIRRDIDRAMGLAGFPRGRRLRYLLIDDLTYLHLQHSYRPFHRMGVLELWTGRITDPLAYLRSRQSDGLVVGCHYLTPAQRRLAAQAGPICAIALARR